MLTNLRHDSTMDRQMEVVLIEFYMSVSNMA